MTLTAIHKSDSHILDAGELECIGKTLDVVIKNLDDINAKYPSGLNNEFSQLLKQKIQEWKESNEFILQIMDSHAIKT
ncbi:MAG: hypothetical protein K8Q89_06240 [Nitrosarchaeum sp.]|nr:hypothetical protein [Nitrosarchaeum sp.]